MARPETHPRLDPNGNPYCSQCQQYLPPSAFGKRSTTAHGYDYACKSCMATKRRAFNARTNAHLRQVRDARNTKYKAMDDTERSIPRLKRCAACKEVKRIRDFGLLRRNRDGHQDRCYDCYNLFRPERKRQPPRSYWIGSPLGLEPAALCSACQRVVPLYECRSDPRGYKRVMMRCVTCRTQARTLWRQDHLIQDRLANHRSRLKNRPHRYGSSIEVVTDADIEAIWAMYDYTCAYCGAADVPLTIDHLIPIANGGAHSKENIVPACLSCNSRKRTLSVEEFLRRNPHRKHPTLRLA